MTIHQHSFTRTLNRKSGNAKSFLFIFNIFFVCVYIMLYSWFWLLLFFFLMIVCFSSFKTENAFAIKLNVYIMKIEFQHSNESLTSKNFSDSMNLIIPATTITKTKYKIHRELPKLYVIK